jgi:hypothetical protein
VTFDSMTGFAPTSPLANWRSVPMLDRIGLSLSALCMVHCLTTTIAVVALASFGGVIVHPLVHEVGMVIALVFGLIALVQGVWRHGHLLPFGVGCFGLGMMAGALSLPHGDGELLATLVGVAVVALGHDLNFRASRS